MALGLATLKALVKFYDKKKNTKKIDDGKRDDRFNALLDSVSTDYRATVRAKAKVSST